MKSKTNKIVLVILLSALIIVILLVGIIPSIQDYQSRHRVYEDMQVDSSRIFDANVNIIEITTENEDTSIGAGASGVVIERDGDVYYVLTAYHVINKTDKSVFRIFTPETITYQEAAENYDGDHLGLIDYYTSLPEATVEYTKEDSDLAIISFESEEDLPVVPVSETIPEKGARIMVVGNPEGEDFVLTYGKIISFGSELTSFGDSQSENLVMRHNAYEAPGSSGSAVYNDDMELVGINIGGGTDVFGRFRCGYMIPSDQINECIADWRSQ